MLDHQTPSLLLDILDKSTGERDGDSMISEELSTFSSVYDGPGREPDSPTAPAGRFADLVHPVASIEEPNQFMKLLMTKTPAEMVNMITETPESRTKFDTFVTTYFCYSLIIESNWSINRTLKVLRIESVAFPQRHLDGLAQWRASGVAKKLQSQMREFLTAHNVDPAQIELVYQGSFADVRYVVSQAFDGVFESAVLHDSFIGLVRRLSEAIDQYGQLGVEYTTPRAEMYRPSLLRDRLHEERDYGAGRTRPGMGPPS